MFSSCPALQKESSGVRGCMRERWSKLQANWYLYQPSGTELFWADKELTRYRPRQPAGGLSGSMYSKSQFHALELMCRERAVVAAKEIEYWLAEAEEWALVRSRYGDEPSTIAPELAPSTKFEN
jgi:hypothetical protein